MRLIMQKAAEQLIPAWEWLLETLQDFIKANPDATQNDAATYMAGVASPFDLATLQIVDRVGALQWFVAQTGASWDQVKNFLVNNPLDMLKKFEPDKGRNLDPSGNTAKITKVISDSFEQEGWEDVTWPTDVSVEFFRDPYPGPTKNFITKKVWTATVDGQPVQVQQLFDNQLVGNRVVITPGPHEVL